MRVNDTRTCTVVLPSFPNSRADFSRVLTLTIQTRSLMANVKYVLGLCAGMAICAASVRAQTPTPSTERFFLNVNVGGELATRTINAVARKTVYDETATVSSHQPLAVAWSLISTAATGSVRTFLRASWCRSSARPARATTRLDSGSDLFQPSETHYRFHRWFVAPRGGDRPACHLGADADRQLRHYVERRHRDHPSLSRPGRRLRRDLAPGAHN